MVKGLTKCLKVAVKLFFSHWWWIWRSRCVVISFENTSFLQSKGILTSKERFDFDTFLWTSTRRGFAVRKKSDWLSWHISLHSAWLEKYLRKKKSFDHKNASPYWMRPFCRGEVVLTVRRLDRGARDHGTLGLRFVLLRNVNGAQQLISAKIWRFALPAKFRVSLDVFGKRNKNLLIIQPPINAMVLVQAFLFRLIAGWKQTKQNIVCKRVCVNAIISAL